MKQEKIFEPEQADAFARALNDELSDQLATRSDFLLMKNDIIQMENSLEIKMARMENRLIKWMIGLVLASTAINVTVTGFLVTL